MDLTGERAGPCRACRQGPRCSHRLTVDPTIPRQVAPLQSLLLLRQVRGSNRLGSQLTSAALAATNHASKPRVREIGVGSLYPSGVSATTRLPDAPNFRQHCDRRHRHHCACYGTSVGRHCNCVGRPSVHHSQPASRCHLRPGSSRQGIRGPTSVGWAGSQYRHGAIATDAAGGRDVLRSCCGVRLRTLLAARTAKWWPLAIIPMANATCRRSLLGFATHRSRPAVGLVCHTVSRCAQMVLSLHGATTPLDSALSRYCRPDSPTCPSQLGRTTRLPSVPTVPLWCGEIALRVNGTYQP